MQASLPGKGQLCQNQGPLHLGRRAPLSSLSCGRTHASPLLPARLWHDHGAALGHAVVSWHRYGPVSAAGTALAPPPLPLTAFRSISSENGGCQPSEDLHDLMQLQLGLLFELPGMRSALHPGRHMRATVFARCPDTLDGGTLRLQKVAVFPPARPGLPGGLDGSEQMSDDVLVLDLVRRFIRFGFATASSHDGAGGGAVADPWAPPGGAAAPTSGGVGSGSSAGGPVPVEACLVHEELVALPQSGSLVLPLVDNSGTFLVGLLVVTLAQTLLSQAPLAAAAATLGAAATAKAAQAHVLDEAVGRAGTGASTSGRVVDGTPQQPRSWRQQARAVGAPCPGRTPSSALLDLQGGLGSSLSSVDIDDPTVLPFSDAEVHSLRRTAPVLAAACTMELRSALAAAQASACSARARSLLRDVQRPLTALNTFGAMLAPRMKTGEPDRDMANGIMMQGRRLKELLWQLEAALHPQTSQFDGSARDVIWPRLPASTSPSASTMQDMVGVNSSTSSTSSRLAATSSARPEQLPPAPMPPQSTLEHIEAADATPSSPSGAADTTRSCDPCGGIAERALAPVGVLAAAANAAQQASGVLPTTHQPVPGSEHVASSPLSPRVITPQPYSTPSSRGRSRNAHQGAPHSAGITQRLQPPYRAGHRTGQQMPSGAAGALIELEVVLPPAGSNSRTPVAMPVAEPKAVRSTSVITSSPTRGTAPKRAHRPSRKSQEAAAVGSSSNVMQRCDLGTVLLPVLTAGYKLAVATGIHMAVQPPLQVAVPEVFSATPPAADRLRSHTIHHVGRMAHQATVVVPELQPRPLRPLLVAVAAAAVSRIVSLLLDLTLQCTPSSGHVTVSARPADSSREPSSNCGGVQLVVMHTGRLVPDRTHTPSRVFVDSGTTQTLQQTSSVTSAGSGFLSWQMAEELVKQAGGQLLCTYPFKLLGPDIGNSAGTGTCVELWLPAATAD